MINEEIYTDNTDTLRIIEDEYRRGAIDQERYLAIRMAILFNKKKEEEMKREIKFRGKDKKTGEWLYGNLQVPTIEGVPYLMRDKEKFQCEVETNTIGQFTGLKDKNGKEIYEGDIVEWLFFYTVHSSNGADGDREELLMGVIEWRQGGFVFRILENDFENAGWYSISDLHTETQTDVEVIGNIYENPELLEK